MNRTIAQIDKDISANRRKLLRRTPVADKFSSSDWQDAWDANADLYSRECALFLERGNAQVELRREARIKSKGITRQASKINTVEPIPARKEISPDHIVDATNMIDTSPLISFHRCSEGEPR